MIGFQEVIFILAILLLVFGPTKLPEVGRTLGRAVREFNKASRGLAEAIESPIESETSKRSVSPAPVKKPTPETKGKPINHGGDEITADKKKEEIPPESIKGE